MYKNTHYQWSYSHSVKALANFQTLSSLFVNREGQKCCISSFSKDNIVYKEKLKFTEHIVQICIKYKNRQDRQYVQVGTMIKLIRENVSNQIRSQDEITFSDSVDEGKILKRQKVFKIRVLSFLSFLLNVLLIEQCHLVHWIREPAAFYNSFTFEIKSND